ncbi:MAG: TSUP family transporter [Desulfobacteraceae bacterium]|jgi:hypothetical protein
MISFDITIEIFIILFLGGFAAGFVDSIAGGGGLISLPVLLSVGLPPQTALGTNKLQGTFGTLSASYNYIRSGKVDLNESVAGIVFTFIGAAAGAWLIQSLDPGLLKHIIPVLLMAVFIYTVISKDLGVKRRDALMPRGWFYLVFGLALGFYDGFFGPGTGSFWTAALMALLGYDMTRAAGATRIMNFISNIVALGVFIMGHNVLYSAGICMAAGQIVGARIGSSLAIKRGARFIRPIFLTVVFLTITRLGYVYYLKEL